MTVEAPVSTVDLSVLTENRPDVQTLSGQERGAEARLRFEFDRLDNVDGAVSIVVPASIKAISPSFLQGMLTRSIDRLGRDGFKNHYVFVTTKMIREQIDDVVARMVGRLH